VIDIIFYSQGPVFPDPLKQPSDLDKLSLTGALDSLQYVFDAITLTRKKLEGKVPLIGFTGAPVRRQLNADNCPNKIINVIKI
jgi:uroporphyrinogen-III decarboxylase